MMQNKLKPVSSVYAIFSSGCNLKMKIRKIKDLTPKGYRIINLDCLQSLVSSITLHACLCKEAIDISMKGLPPIKLQTEVKSFGLACIMLAECQGCLKKFRLDTSPKVPGSRRFDVNVRAVWGSMATGNGPSHLNELLGTLNSPGLSHVSFSCIENEIGEWWHSILERDMLETGSEERRLAIERNDFHQEVPAITVITDGGWSKRTHKHSYNAAGGVAIIIGQQTKKMLHIGVRNKYCYLCCNNHQSTPHTCFKNWDQDSQSMESDIILEGFLQAEEKHGLRYIRVVGDGDSSVFAKIREQVPGWGRFVAKEECANHVCKCYRSNLEKLVNDNLLYKGKHHLSKTTRVRLTSALRCAIRVRSKEFISKKCDKLTASKKLSHDIKNSVHHVFGKHDNCSDFCRARVSCENTDACTSANEHNTSPLLADNISVIDNQIDFWNEGSSISSQEEARLGTTTDYKNVEQHIIRDVTALLSKIADKSHRLINNFTTNLAENWMHIRTKFDGGKVHNLCNRGSWHARCYGGGLRMNFGPKWSCNVWESATGTEPGSFFRNLYARHEQQLRNSTKHKAKPNIQALRWKKKMLGMKSGTSKRAREAYGPEAIDVTDDVSSPELESLCQTFYNNHVDISSHQCNIITNSTQQQSQSGLWHAERRNRITASNFGCIVKRKPTIPVQKIVRTLLYSSFLGNRHTKNGLLHENTTIEEYKLKQAEQNDNVCVQKSGLVIHNTHKFLAASPDGVVSTSTGEVGLIEIKNLLHSKPLNLWDASKNPNFCLKISNGQLQLKRNHNYFYLWNDKMLPKLKAFYDKVILPELACPRDGKSPGIREPGIWYVPPHPRHKPKKRKKTSTAAKSSQSSTSSTCYRETTEQSPSTIPQLRSKNRNRQTKFLGPRIAHEWIVDENSQKKDWFKGTVLSLISGTDGDLDAVYEVFYEGEDECYEIDHLIEDYQSGSVQFCDV